MRDVPDFPFIAGGVGLYPGEIPFVESCGLRILAQKKLVGAIHIFDPSPGVVAFEKAQSGLQQIAVADVPTSYVLISSPKHH